MKDATAELDTIRRWWQRWPDANIGIPTGRPSGWVVLDVDSERGGFASLEQVAGSLESIPETVCAETGGGGLHLIFRYPADRKIRSRNGILPGLDVKSDGGSIVAQPRYRWLRGPKGNPSAIPDWLERLLEDDRSGSRGKREPLPASIDEGTRNSTLFSYACSLRAKGHSEDNIRKILVERNLTCCKPPLTTGEVHQIAESAGKYRLGQKEKGSDAQRLIQLLNETELFHTMDKKAYATVRIDGHDEHLEIGSRSFRSLLVRLFYLNAGRPPSQTGLQGATAFFEAKALYDSPMCPIYLRVAHQCDAIWIDLCDPHRRIIKVTREGWMLVENAPVKFRRPPGMLSLAEPERGGSVDLLGKYINLPDEQASILITVWLLAALSPFGPYPILAIYGEQGSAKSYTTRLLRSLLDNCKALLRSCPSDVRDLMVMARSSWVISLDNISGLKEWISDALCRLATGGGFSTRRLFTNDEEEIFDAQRPIIINGIAELTHRADFVDRCILLELLPIPKEQRRSEAELNKEFRADAPKILGALLDALSVALRNLPQVKLTELPRMADFARFGVAAEPAFPWPEGTFLRAYKANRASAVGITLASDPLACAVRDFMADPGSWEGSPSELLSQLEGFVDERVLSTRAWPGSASLTAWETEYAAHCGYPAVQACPITLREKIRLAIGNRLFQMFYVPDPSSAAGCKDLRASENTLNRILTELGLAPQQKPVALQEYIDMKYGDA